METYHETTQRALSWIQQVRKIQLGPTCTDTGYIFFLFYVRENFPFFFSKILLFLTRFEIKIFIFILRIKYFFEGPLRPDPPHNHFIP